MTKAMIAILMVIVGVIGVSCGIAFTIFGLKYLIVGFALWITQEEFVRMFASLSVGMWMLTTATAMMSILNKGLTYIWETCYEEN